MSLNWMIPVLVACAVFASAGSIALCLVLATRRRMRRQQKCHLAESESRREAVEALEAAIAALQEQLRQVCLEVKQNAPSAAAYPPSSALPAAQRAEALRMYRHGSDRQTVSTALGLKTAEVALLEKVHFLSPGAA